MKLRKKRLRNVVTLSVWLTICPTLAQPYTGEEVQARMDHDVLNGRPLVAHVVVALADNQHQWHQRIPKELGNGQNPIENLYWGTRYGVRAFFNRSRHWQVSLTGRPHHPGILQRVVFQGSVDRGERKAVPVYVVADAWDGREIRRATRYFLRLTRSAQGVDVPLSPEGGGFVTAGGQAHLIAFVGHNGLGDFLMFGRGKLPRLWDAEEGNPPKSAMMLACGSMAIKPYFDKADVHGLIYTTGSMSPEAYSLDIILRRWFAGKNPNEVHEAAATTYCRFQQPCSISWARELFSIRPDTVRLWDQIDESNRLDSGVISIF